MLSSQSHSLPSLFLLARHTTPATDPAPALASSTGTAKVSDRLVKIFAVDPARDQVVEGGGEAANVEREGTVHPLQVDPRCLRTCRLPFKHHTELRLQCIESSMESLKILVQIPLQFPRPYGTACVSLLALTLLLVQKQFGDGSQVIKSLYRLAVVEVNLEVPCRSSDKASATQSRMGEAGGPRSGSTVLANGGGQVYPSSPDFIARRRCAKSRVIEFKDEVEFKKGEAVRLIGKSKGYEVLGPFGRILFHMQQTPI
ncbi:hypothetical protein Tsubulata_036664 [Turnera subulata]|uniref:Uncharacterized protein n=1 Tax=Turnera subulata TaxID=218843 RepID=A0A9Q0FHE3_9ROSI|nr:hypothetical protein Tsubulata_036664 [Turnera subulata]